MYDHFKETFLFLRETISLEVIQVVLSSKKLKEKFEVKAFGTRDGLVTKGRLSTNNRGGRRRSKLRSKNGGNTSFIRCYYCKKEGHITRFYPERQEKAINLDRLSQSSKRSSGSSVSG